MFGCNIIFKSSEYPHLNVQVKASFVTYINERFKAWKDGLKKLSGTVKDYIPGKALIKELVNPAQFKQLKPDENVFNRTVFWLVLDGNKMYLEILYLNCGHKMRTDISSLLLEDQSITLEFEATPFGR